MNPRKDQGVGKWRRAWRRTERQCVLFCARHNSSTFRAELLAFLLIVALLVQLTKVQVTKAPRLDVATATTLSALANAPLEATTPRGIVLPLFDDIALLGISLIAELRQFGVQLPVDVPHCGDLEKQYVQVLTKQASLQPVRTYDVCAKALEATRRSGLQHKPLFCTSREHCERRFRSFDIKVLGLLYSRFAQTMMLDADVAFFQEPSKLWTLDKFQSTGTLFFHDRVGFPGKFLAKRVLASQSALHVFTKSFDRTPFEDLAIIAREGEMDKEESRKADNAKLRRKAEEEETPFEPSEFLRTSHAWNLRSGHLADSSVMLWDKIRQQRATAILGSFLALDYDLRAPSYGDKEFYFLACELAQSQYAFSDFGVGSISTDKPGASHEFCGDAIHFFPTQGKSISTESVPPLYINSDHIVDWDLDHDKLHHTTARSPKFYQLQESKNARPQECLLNVTTIALGPPERTKLQRRQQLYRDAAKWVDKFTHKAN